MSDLCFLSSEMLTAFGSSSIPIQSSTSVGSFVVVDSLAAANYSSRPTQGLAGSTASSNQSGLAVATVVT